MPRRDGTGPVGMGLRTGFGAGPCCGGFGWGRGFGMGWGYRMTGEDRKKMLQEQAQYLKEDLEAVEKELSGLEK